MVTFYRYITILILLLGVMTTHAQERKKVGLVLSGGGAKGVAHIGAIKVLEEAGIPIDYITGTSMGAIIGGLYAIGYDTYTLDSMVRSQNWMELLSDRVPRRNMSFGEKEIREKYLLTVPLTKEKKLIMPSALVSGNNTYNLLTELTIGYHDSISFRQLPIPFACVAYDMVTGKTAILDSGLLPRAIRASMSIPGAFEPVRINGMVLIDGGISNNFPVDVVREMGAEIIIGVDVGAGLRDASKIKGLGDMFNQITYFTGEEAYDRNKKMVDLYVHPDIEPYNAGSFSAAAIDTLLVRGEIGMRRHWDKLMTLKEKIGVPNDYLTPVRDTVELDRPIQIKHIIYEGLEIQKKKTLDRVSGLKEYSIITSGQIQTAAAKLQGIGSLSEVNYRLEGKSPYTLVFEIKEASRNSLSLGVRFDTEEYAAIMVNATLATSKMSNSHFDITGRLSENPYGRVAYVMGNEAERQLTASYMFTYNNLSLYGKGERLSNMDFGHHVIDVNYSNISVRNFKAGLGIKYEYYDYHSLLAIRDIELKPKSQGFVNYYASINYESFDRRYNPLKGHSWQIGYTFHTSDFATFNGKKPYSSVYLNYLVAISVSKRVAFLPGIFSRVLIGKNFAFPTLNHIGGTVPGRYIPQQIPFVGVRKLETVDNAILGVRLDFRVRLWMKNFVSLKTNYAKTDSYYFNLHNGRDLFGVGIGYSYNTIIGPFDLLVDWSNHDRKVGVYCNLGYYF